MPMQEKQKSSRSLVTLLTFAFLALSLAVLVVAITSQMVFNLQSQQQTIAGEQQLIAQDAASTVAAFIQEKFNRLETAARLSSPTSVSQEERESILGNLMGLEPVFRNLILLDSQEQTLAQASRISQASVENLLQRVDSELLVQVRQGNRYISSVYVDDVTSEPMVVIAVPATNAFGDFQGTLMAEVNLKFMWDLVDQLEIGETGVAYVVDREGNLIAFEDVARVLRGENVSDLNEVGEFVRSSAPVDETGTSVYSGIDGKSVVGTYVPLGTPDWAVVTEVPVAEAYRDFIRSAGVSAVVMVAVTVLAGFLGITAARRLAVPLINLTETASRIAEGETDLQAKVEGPSEVSTLASAFNHMTDQLRELIAGLENRTRELEASQRVTFAASERVTPDELLDLVVNLIRDQFDLYHAQVYIINEEQDAAVLRQSTGYAGRQLLQRGHKIPLDATALVTKAIETGAPVLVDDTSQDPDFMSNPLLSETKSELVVPLKLKEQIIGVLDAQDRTPGRFGESTVNLFRSMANQIATLFENSELLERVTEQTESLTIFTNQLRTAADIARRMGTILDPEQLLSQTVELLQSRFGLYHAHIYTLDEANGQLVMRSGSGEVGRVLRKQGHSIPLDAEKSLVARAARSEEVVLVEDTSLESDFLPNPLLPQTRSEVAIPLISGNKVLGVLDIQDNQPDRFTDADIDTFRTLSGQIATTLQTAGVFEQTQLRLRVSQALASAQTEEQVLDALIQQAGLYPQGAVVIQSIDPEARELTVISRRGAAFDSGLEIPPDGSRLTTSDFPLLQHVSSDTPFVTSNLLHDERIDPTAHGLLSQMGLVSFAALPITAGTEWLGIVAVSSKEEGFFDERKLNLYRTLVEQGATALQIARLNDATEQERNFSDTVINSLPTTFFMLDTQGNLIRWNNKFLEMSGLSPKELKDVQVTDLVVEEDQAVVLETVQKVFAEGQAEVEARGLSKDRGAVPYHFTAARAIVDNQAYLVGAGLDITERKRAEEERERFTNQLRTAADLAEQVNAILDPDQLLPEVVNELQNRFGLYHVHVYTLSEPTAEQLVNADAAEVSRLMRERPLTLRAGSGEPGQKLLERGHTIALHIEKSLVARAARDRRPVLVNDTTEDPDFMPNPLLPETRSEVAVPLLAGENVLGVLDVQDNRPDRFTQSDVDVLVTLAGQIATALQNASYFEEVQRTAEQLREVDRLKSEFLASMSHELRTPLNSIIGYTEIMLMGLDTDLSPETLEDVQAIYDNGQHLLHIINDVLDLAKIEAGRLELNKEEVPVEVLVDAASSSVTGLLVNKEKPVEFKVEVEKGLPTIYGDQVRLNQVINNLASNAVKFTDEGHITMRAFRDDGWICLEVEDTGIGIAEEYLNKIFERFQQVDGSNARKQEGTGLGLAITRHLVQMHGGTIKVKSKLGKGSTFTVRLPIVENSTQDATPEVSQETTAPEKAAAKPKSSKKKKSTKAPTT